VAGAADVLVAVKHPDGTLAIWATIGSPDLAIVISVEDATRLANWLTEEQRNGEISRLTHDLEELRADVVRGCKIAHDVTLETQSVEEACKELVRLVLVARAQRDELWDQLVNKNSACP
jgi:hypothetical protein